jgi:type IV pilus assembly protein PilX
MDRQRQLPPPARQRGVALIIGLVILVVLALLGASAYSVATQDERIAGNARDRARAMDAAETMLRDCESFIRTASPAFDGTVAGMFAAPTPGSGWLAENAAAWSGPTRGLTNPVNADWNTAQPPQCIAEGFTVSPLTAKTVPVKVAHVTARGYGLNRGTVVTLVSYYSFY